MALTYTCLDLSNGLSCTAAQNFVFASSDHVWRPDTTSFAKLPRRSALSAASLSIFFDKISSHLTNKPDMSEQSRL